MILFYLPIIVYTLVISIICIFLRRNLYRNHMCGIASGLCVIQTIISIVLGKIHESSISMIYVILMINSTICIFVPTVIMMLDKMIHRMYPTFDEYKLSLSKRKFRLRYVILAALPLIAMLITFNLVTSI